MDSWKRFDETVLPGKEAFYNKLKLNEICDEDCIHAQKVFEEFKLKNLGEYHDLYVEKDTLEVEYVMQYRGMQKIIISI